MKPLDLIPRDRRPTAEVILDILLPMISDFYLELYREHAKEVRWDAHPDLLFFIDSILRHLSRDTVRATTAPLSLLLREYVNMDALLDLEMPRDIPRILSLIYEPGFPGPKLEAFLAKELIPCLERHLRENFSPFPEG